MQVQRNYIRPSQKNIHRTLGYLWKARSANTIRKKFSGHQPEITCRKKTDVAREYVDNIIGAALNANFVKH